MIFEMRKKVREKFVKMFAELAKKQPNSEPNRNFCHFLLWTLSFTITCMFAYNFCLANYTSISTTLISKLKFNCKLILVTSVMINKLQAPVHQRDITLAKVEAKVHSAGKSRADRVLFV